MTRASLFQFQLPRSAAALLVLLGLVCTAAVACSSDPVETVTAVGESPTPQLILDIVPPAPTPQGAPTATFQSGTGADASIPAAPAAAEVVADGSVVIEEVPAADSTDAATEPADIGVDETLGIDGSDILGTAGPGTKAGAFFKLRVRGEDTERALDDSATENTLSMTLNGDDTGSISARVNVTFPDGTVAVAEIEDDSFEWDSARGSARTTVTGSLDIGGDTANLATLGIGDVADGVGSICFSSGSCLSFEFA